MARKVATLLLIFGYCSCMEMRETVERTVMVRTTGSDLQPAATGYIYKKESDGPVSVTKMGESEVIEQFSKLYNTPESYEEYIVKETPVYSEKEDEIRSKSFSSSPRTSTSQGKYTTAAHESSDSPKSQDSAPQSSATHASQEPVKPVVEKVDDKIDGIANEEFDKLFEDYIKQVNYKNSFTDYLHGLDHNDHDIYHGNGHEDQDEYYLKGYDYAEKGLKGNDRHSHHEKGEPKHDYLIDHGKYYVYNYKEPKTGFHEDDDHARHFINRLKSNRDDHTYDASQTKGEGTDGFHEGLKLDELKKNKEFYDGQTFKGTNHDYGVRGHEDYGSGAKGYDGRDTHESGQHNGSFRKSNAEKESADEYVGVHSSEDSEESGHEHPRAFGIKGQLDTRKSYGYEIKH
ncbi:unnamed protein product [Arctia plantaginis]|uniref:Uncharacterized protein n=1 Tax=Arctia plantaginis TaxID=874455 RepID=A0A8S0ZK95_ARCPL|nr:unnamed protein product [Arctia plantaginis]